jgi:hypothetical protein
MPSHILSHQPSAISHILSHQPSAISHQPSAISHQPSAVPLLPQLDYLRSSFYKTEILACTLQLLRNRNIAYDNSFIMMILIVGNPACIIQLSASKSTAEESIRIDYLSAQRPTVRVDAMDRKNELNESSKWGRHPEV